jgi:hypothetical protein
MEAPIGAYRVIMKNEQEEILRLTKYLERTQRLKEMSVNRSKREFFSRELWRTQRQIDLLKLK